MRQLWAILWGGKWLIAAIGFVGTTITLIVLLLLPNIYRAEALLAPNRDEGASGFAGTASQYAGLAAIAGIDLGAGEDEKTVLGLEILRSRKFVSDFIERHDLLVPVMAARGWDSDSGELKIDAALYDVDSQQWIRDVKPPKIAEPSMQEAYEEFSEENLYVSQDKVTGFVTIAVEHYSPTVARQWVDWLVQDINLTVMNRDVAEARQAIGYLQEQIARTQLADLKNVFFSLIEEQTKTMMLASVSDEYLLKTIDPAVVPEEKARPKRALVAAASILVSLIVGVFVVLLISSLPPRRQSTPVRVDGHPE